MSTPAPDEISIEDPLCNSSLGSMVTLDYVTPLTVSYGVKRDRPFVPASGPSATAVLPGCPALQRQQSGCNG